MTQLKDIDRKIAFELFRNSKQSDRQLGKKLGVSQATITRRRKMLEKELIPQKKGIKMLEKGGLNG